MEARPQIESQCHWCGEVLLRPEDLRCAINPSDEGNGLCEFACPICQRPVLLASTQTGIEALSKEGARAISGTAPFEILEPHLGDALSWDDVLDLRLALARTTVPQAELVR